MADKATEYESPTRRDTIKYGGAVVGGGLLAGCTGGGSGTTPSTAADEGSADGTATDEESWTVTLEPSGTITFTEVPQRFATYHGAWADIMITLGQLDGLAATRRPEQNIPLELFGRLPGVEIDLSDVLDLFPGGADSADKEVFYEADPDINIIDPGTAKTYLDMDEGDIEEIEENVAPFFGSDLRRPQLSEKHPYYSLYEGMERIARVFREEERFAKLDAFHEEFVETVRLPPVAEREWDTYMIGHGNWWGDFSEFYPTRATVAGYQKQPFHDLGFRAENNAFDEMIPEGESSIKTDKEGILEANPDIIIWYGGTQMNQEGGWNAFGATGDWEEDVVEPFNEDPVLSEVTAVEEDRIVPTGTYGGGPVHNYFVTEDLAKALFPAEFGEFQVGEYPEDEHVFDRQRLADIINGDI